MADFETIVGALASGARVVLRDDGYPELRMPGPVMDGVVWDRLCREGWLEPMANGGAFKLTDSGLLAYLRSTDEMRNEPLSQGVDASLVEDLGAGTGSSTSRRGSHITSRSGDA